MNGYGSERAKSDKALFRLKRLRTFYRNERVFSIHILAYHLVLIIKGSQTGREEICIFSFLQCTPVKCITNLFICFL